MTRSAGLLLFRRGQALEVLIGHMGGPYWQRRDAGAWTIPKGEYRGEEDALAGACREFTEELGLPVPEGPLRPLGEVRQRGGKVVTAWALEADVDLAAVTTGTFELEWPPGSGTVRLFPELDRVEWTTTEAARVRLVRGQVVLLDRLLESLG